LIEAVRSLVIVGWDAEALVLGFGCAILIIVAGFGLSVAALRERMSRT
jgi:hypothetical protein